MPADAAEPGYSKEFAAVAEAERAWIERRRTAAKRPPLKDDLCALAFSGGGIRSATVNLGVLQALERRGVLSQIDILSSVSGGGYVASSYSWLRATTPDPAAPTFEQRAHNGERVIDWLRTHGKFLIASRGFTMITLLAAIVASTLTNLLILAPPLLLLVELASLDWLPLPRALADMLGVPGHHGFWMLLLLGLASMLSFLPLMLVLALKVSIGANAARRSVEGLRLAMGRVLGLGIALIAVGCMPLIVSALERLFAAVLPAMSGHAIHLAWLGSFASGLIALSRGDPRQRPSLQPLVMIGLSLLVYGLVIVAYAVVRENDLLHSTWFWVLVGNSAVLALVCDLNSISMHGYYRARLTNSFLPRLQPEIAPAAFAMAEISPETGQPLHLINTTLNSSSSRSVLARARQGESFFFSPVYRGSTATGYARQSEDGAADVLLANACTISAAAIDPDTVNTRGRALAMLMALLNVRLGYWARNPSPSAKPNPPIPNWWLRIAREMTGLGLDGGQRETHLSDGGGFENLALYELIRRRARYVMVVDAGYDPTLALADLGRAIERVRVDFGAEIDVPISSMQRDPSDGSHPLHGHPFLTGTIRYADGSNGWLLVIKPLLTAGLGADVYAYARANPAFPNEPTSDQFFDEAQFEAYRRLGYAIVDRLLGEHHQIEFGEWIEGLHEAESAAASF